MSDRSEFDPPIGRAETLATGIRRIVAPNPSPMTFRGTNTYLVGQTALAVIDPGPDDRTHLEAILRALEPGQWISHIFVTHAHLDHAPLAGPLAEVTGAPVLAFGGAEDGRSSFMSDVAATLTIGGGEGVDTGFAPDRRLEDGARVDGDGWSIEAIWTPGHMSNHMCFAAGDALFCGDHVMAWASSLVSPPDGDLTAFMESCARLRQRAEAVYYPGHGQPIAAPHERLDWLIHHRKSREADIVGVLRDGPATPRYITQRVYVDVPRALLAAAERNVLAHLMDLSQRDVVDAVAEITPATRFTLKQNAK